MNEKPSKWKVFTAGIIRENPVLRLVLGCCSALAVTTTVSGAVGMGLAMTFVLVCSNIVISALRKVIPAKVHLPCYIVIIATFVTVVQMVLQAFVPDLYKALGVYLALIVFVRKFKLYGDLADKVHAYIVDRERKRTDGE